MNLTQRISKYPLEYVRSKRKKRYWLLIWLVSAFAVCDMIVLFVLFKILLPVLLDNTSYLLPEDAQEYTHLSTYATTSPPKLLTFSPDGKILACGGYNEILLWDTETGNQLYAMREHAGAVTALTFSPDGKTFASSSESDQNTVLVCDTATGQVISYLSEHSSLIAYLDFSPDGSTLVSADVHGSVIAWDTNTFFIHQRIQGRFAFARRSDTYQDYYTFPESYKGSILTRWNREMRDTNAISTSNSLKSVVESASFNDNGIIAMAPGSNTLSIYLSSNPYPIQSLMFSPDGKILASGSRNEYQPFNITTGKIHLWEVDTGQTVATLKTPGSRVDILAFSPDGKTLASNGNKHWKGRNKIFIWDLITYELISIIETDSPSKITALAFAPDNITLVSSNSSGRVDLWDITGNIKNR